MRQGCKTQNRHARHIRQNIKIVIAALTINNPKENATQGVTQLDMAGRLGARTFCLPLAGIACHGLIA